MVAVVQGRAQSGDNGMFMTDYLTQLERLMKEKIPRCGLRATLQMELNEDSQEAV